MSALPGTSGFVGEFLTLIGTFKVNIWVATLATIGVILSAAYALWLYRKVIFGALDKPRLAAIRDLDYREIITLGPLVVLTILFGVFPKPVLDMSAASVAQLLDNYQQAIGAAKTAAPCCVQCDDAQKTADERTFDVPRSAAGPAGDRARGRRDGAADARRLPRRALRRARSTGSRSCC